ARPFNPDFSHADREKWICFYPCYINRAWSRARGRKVSYSLAVDNPRAEEIRDVCAAAGMTLGVENKIHPRERDIYDKNLRGRVRIQLKNEDGSLRHPDNFPNRMAVFNYVAAQIPKLKTRQGASGGGGGASGGGGGASGGGGGGQSSQEKKKQKKKR
ncbi:hypothetical protein BOX15_Mlig020474g2, partial [Macrostomum lignano]